MKNLKADRRKIFYIRMNRVLSIEHCCCRRFMLVTFYVVINKTRLQRWSQSSVGMSLNDYFISISMNRIPKIFKRVSGSWRLSSKTRGRLLSQRRKYKNAHKYANGNKSNGNGILSGFDYDAFVNAFESLATGLNQDRTGIGRKDQDLLYFFYDFWPFFDRVCHFWPQIVGAIFLNFTSNFINIKSAIAWATSIDSVCVLRFRIQTKFNQSAFETKFNSFGWSRWYSFVWVTKI